MAGRLLNERRRSASALLAVFVVLTVQAGFFHSCEPAGHAPDVVVSGDPAGAVHGDHASVCTACLLTRALAATEMTTAPVATAVEWSQSVGLAEQRPASTGARVSTFARSPPGC